MLKFLIDIFCKDTIVGLSSFETIRKNTIYKNKYSSLFLERKLYNKPCGYFYFTDQIACHP